jgi:outer membrane receptor protein involved in Fe transport
LLWRADGNVDITPAIFYQNIRRGDTSFFWTQLSDPSAGRLVSGNTLAQPSSDRMALPSLKIEVQLPRTLMITIDASYLDRLATGTIDATNFFPIFFGNSPFPPVPPGFYWASDVQTTQRQDTEEVRLQTADADARVRWLVGMFRQSFTQHDLEVDRAPLLSELPGASEPFSDPNTASISTRMSEFSLYGSLDWRLTQSLTATVGLRAEHSHIDAATSFMGALYHGAVTTSAGTQTENPVTPKLGLSWQPTPDSLFYANAATGYRAGGVNPPLLDTCPTNIPVSDTFPSERTRSYELGAKANLADARVRLEGSAFDTRWSHIQTVVFLPCGVPYTFQGGRATSRGAEIAVHARVGGGLSAALSVAYVDARYDNTVSAGYANITIAGTSIGDPKTTNLIPPWALVGVLEYQRNVGAYGFYLRAQDLFRSRAVGPFTSRYPSAASYDPTLPVPPSTNIVELRLGAMSRRLKAELFIDNLTNSSPALAVHHTYVGSPIDYATTFRPRTVGMALTYSF